MWRSTGWKSWTGCSTDQIGCSERPVETWVRAGWLDETDWRFRAGLARERRQLPQTAFVVA